MRQFCNCFLSNWFIIHYISKHLANIWENIEFGDGSEYWCIWCVTSQAGTYLALNSINNILLRYAFGLRLNMNCINPSNLDSKTITFPFRFLSVFECLSIFKKQNDKIKDTYGYEFRCDDEIKANFRNEYYPNYNKTY